MTLSEAITNSRCFHCVPREAWFPVQLYEAITAVNGEPPTPPPSQVVLGNPETEIIFGDPNAGTMFGTP